MSFSPSDGLDCTEVIAFDREVDGSIEPALAAMEQLLAGPSSAEEAVGASSFFSTMTADAVRSVSLSGGVLTVDLDDLRAAVPNASSGCGSEQFTSNLNATAFQFSTVNKVRYLFAGSCEDFGEFVLGGLAHACQRASPDRRQISWH